MGGYGSTRWGWHNKKRTVEDCKSFSIGDVLGAGPGLRSISWKRGNNPTGSISYRARYNEEGQPWGLDLLYTVNGDSLEYTAPIVKTLTSWGSPRYWFLCPNRNCNRRVGKLYLAPGSKHFLCRHCHNLTYTKSQESHKYETLYERLAGGIPGMTGHDVAEMLHGPGLFDALEAFQTGNLSKLPKHLKRKLMAWACRPENVQRAVDRLRALEAEEEAAQAAKYSRYLSGGDLLERAGLTAAELEALSAARLLVPDHEGLYRPKLEGWAGKLATLLHAGWNIDELRRWSAGRWSAPDPRQWPPDRAAWSKC